MKNFDTQLIASAPLDTAVDHNFTDLVMQGISRSQLVVSDLSTKPLGTPLFAQLRHIPKFAAIVIAAASLIALGGTAYAVYKVFWENPQVTTTNQVTNQFGRSQVVAQFENCGDQVSQAVFEVKIGNALDETEIGKILQARCELDTIRSAVGETAGQADAGKVPRVGVSKSSMVMLYPAAGQVSEISGTSLLIVGDQHAPSDPLVLNNKTQFIIDGALASRSQIVKGDTVLFVQNITTNDTTKQNDNGQYVTEGIPSSREVLYVIKPSLPYEYYNVGKQSLIAQRQACTGNPNDSCIQTQWVDIYTSSAVRSGERRTVQGVITRHDGNTLTMQSSSGRIFTIATPSNIIDNFNTNKSSLYNNVNISEGDLLQASYYSDGASLTARNIESIQFGLDVALKSRSVDKY